MKRLNKGLVRISGALLAAGLALAIAGWAMGGQTTMEVDVAGYRINVGMNGVYSKDGGWVGRNETVSVQDNLAAFDKLDVDVSLGDVDIVPSDHFGLELSWHGKNYELHFTNENGTLKVWSTSIPNIGINLDFNYGGKVIVYIPEGTRLADATVHTAMGDMDLSGFHADQLDVRANMGSVSLTNAVIGGGVLDLDMGDLDVSTVNADSLELTLSMGRLECYDISTTKELTMKNSMGDIEVQGSLAGRTKADASMGDVSISSDLSDYGYDLSTDMGTVRVNGDKQDSKAKLNGGANVITVENSMGNIYVDFN